MNDQVDRYSLERRIGKGGMAEVFLATAEGPHGFRKQVAIKRILSRHSQADNDLKQRFIREAQIAVGLSHANIVQVLDFGGLDDALYIVMEFIEGMDLRLLLNDTARYSTGLPMQACMQIVTELCKGLAFAHDQGIVHRDISPANILLANEGAVKIADFGIAQAVDSFKTETGFIVGKWRYMSPEQTLGETLDHRSDIFAVGAILYEVCTGGLLFNGKNPEEIVRQIQGDYLPLITHTRPDAPPQLDAILARCMSRKIADRYSSAKQMIADLREVCLNNRWLPSSDDVAGLVADSAQPFLDRTKPLFALPDTHDDAQSLNKGIAAQMARLGVLGQPGTAVTARHDSPSSPTQGTMLLRKKSPGDGIPVWETEVTPEEPGSLPPVLPPAKKSRRGLWLGGGALLAIVLGVVLALSASGPPSVVGAAAYDARPDGSATIANVPKIPVVSDASPSDAATAIAASLDANQTLASALLPLDAAPTTRDARVKRVSSVPHKPKVAMGTIAIWVEPWADVYLGRKKIGRAPKKNLRLPLGKHRLRLVNPSLGVQKSVTVEVPSATTYRFQLDAKSP